MRAILRHLSNFPSLFGTRNRGNFFAFFLSFFSFQNWCDRRWAVFFFLSRPEWEKEVLFWPLRYLGTGVIFSSFPFFFSLSLRRLRPCSLVCSRSHRAWCGWSCFRPLPSMRLIFPLFLFFPKMGNSARIFVISYGTSPFFSFFFSSPLVLFCSLFFPFPFFSKVV